MNNYVLGLDLSMHEWGKDAQMRPVKPIDWAKAYNSGARFAFLHCTTGNNYLDVTFQRNWDGAQAAGLLCGSYHWYKPNLSPDTQAAWFRQNMRKELPVVVDVEDKSGATVKLWTALNRFITLLDTPVIIYTAYDYWMTYCWPLGHLASKHRLWIANYRTGAPLVPTPWQPGGWTFWQYTDRGWGEDFGCSSKQADLDLFNGSLQELTLCCV